MSKHSRRFEVTEAIGCDYSGRLAVVELMIERGMFRCARWQLRSLLEYLEPLAEASPQDRRMTERDREPTPKTESAQEFAERTNWNGL